MSEYHLYLIENIATLATGPNGQRDCRAHLAD